MRGEEQAASMGAGWYTTADIARATGTTRSRAHANLRRAEAHGLVESRREGGALEWRHVREGVSLADRVLAWLEKQDEPRTAPEVAAGVGAVTRTVYTALGILEDAEAVVCVGVRDGVRGAPPRLWVAA